MEQTKIKIQILQRQWFALVRWLNALLRFFSLRKSRRFWGMVYDSVTKQPLDPVIVKLLYADNNTAAQTSVTDLGGRYGFLARPGKFKIFAKKSNYAFPSQRITAGNDGIFTDVYRGEFFELYSESEVIGPNIPMDPVNFDWNQKAKLKILNTYPFWQLFFRKLVAVLFWFGFVLALIYALDDFFRNLSFFPIQRPEKWFLVYGCLFALNAVLPEGRLWGRLSRKKNRRRISGARLELTNPALPGVTLAKARSETDGRFLLRANPGKYILRVYASDSLAEIPVIAHNDGVINLDFVLY